MVGGESLDCLLNPVELTDTVERLLGDRRSDGGMNVEELAPDVGPATGLSNPVAGKQLVEPGIAIGVDHAGEALEVRPRVLALAVRRVEEQRCRRPVAGEGPLIANIGPQSSGLGL